MTAPATDRLARLRDELASGRNVNGAWLDEDAAWLLAEVERLQQAASRLVDVEWELERAATHGNGLDYDDVERILNESKRDG